MLLLPVEMCIRDSLCEALEVLTAWGFSYKTVAFVWVKQNRRNDELFTGMGYWTRANAEICILATKGHPKRVDAGVRQVILSHIEEHSKKPDEVVILAAAALKFSY